MVVVISLVQYLCYLFGFLIFIRSVLSWFSPRPTNVLTIYLYRVTEPILSPVRRVIPRAGVVDFSPLVAIILLYIIAAFMGFLIEGLG